MARGRMINKIISLDEKVNALPDDTARLLFTWLIPHLDCEGRMHGDPTTVKSIVFPRRNISTQRIEKYLTELETAGLILRYSINGNQYLCAPNFEKHQCGLRKSQESPSQIPPFTTDLKRSKSVITPLQVETKVETKTKEEVKEETKDKENNKRKYGEFQNVLLTDEEYQKLKDKLGNAAESFIERLSGYMESHKKKHYDSHYATILNWSRREGKVGTNRNPRELPQTYADSPDYPDLA